MTTKTKIAIVVLNYNNIKDTLECLDSLKNINYDNFEVVLVDNNSQDESKTVLKNFSREKLHIIFLENNLGFSGGNNEGIKYALDRYAEYVLVLNNDTKVDSNILIEFLSEFKKYPDAGVLTSAIYFYDEPDILWFGGKTKIEWRKMDRAISSEYFSKTLPQDINSKEVNFITGCCMFIKREVFERVGMFDDRFFLYFEDADFSMRTKKAGYKLIWTPRAKIWHKVSRTTLVEVGTSNIHYYNTRNILLLAKKHGPWWIKIYMYLWAFYKFLKQIIKLAFPFRFNKQISFSIMRGIRDYYLGSFGAK